MKYLHDIGKEPNLQKVVIVSAVLHVIFIAFAVIPLKMKQREVSTFYVKLVGQVRAPVRTPVSGPKAEAGKDKITSPPEKVKKALPPDKAVKAPVKADMSLERENKLKGEINKIRVSSEIAKLRKKREGAKDIEVIKKDVSEGAGAPGLPGEGGLAGPDSYYAVIYEKISSQWVYPDIETKGLETIIAIKIGKDGKITIQEVEKSSGNRLLDRSVLKALAKASPLPPPPVEMEIGVRFRPNEN